MESEQSRDGDGGNFGVKLNPPCRNSFFFAAATKTSSSAPSSASLRSSKGRFNHCRAEKKRRDDRKRSVHRDRPPPASGWGNRDSVEGRPEGSGVNVSVCLPFCSALLLLLLVCVVSLLVFFCILVACMTGNVSAWSLHGPWFPLVFVWLRHVECSSSSFHLSRLIACLSTVLTVSSCQKLYKLWNKFRF